MLSYRSPKLLLKYSSSPLPNRLLDSSLFSLFSRSVDLTFEEYRSSQVVPGNDGYNACLLCGNAIRSTTNLRRHFEERHSSASYTCPVAACLSEHRTRRALSKHIDQKHPSLKGHKGALRQRFQHSQ